MSQEELITVAVNGLVFVLAAWLIVLLLRLTLTPPAQDLTDDADFEEFYCDLCSFDLTVDFSREEAEELYRTWQNQSKSAERIVETKKGDRDVF